MNQSNTRSDRDGTSARIRQLTVTAMLTAIVVVLQLLGNFIQFGPVAITLVLVPIVVGAALYGPLTGGWLGLVFSIMVMFSPSTAAFTTINPIGTILTVVAKGTVAGLLTGLVFQAVSRWNTVVAAVVSAIVCPVCNTGIFLIGCRLFFWPTINEWAAAAGFANAGTYAIVGLAGINALVELGVNCVLAPVIISLVRLGKKTLGKEKTA